MTMASPSPSTWHSITPSTRPLSLTILELTPLALTLSLTLASPVSSSSTNHLHPSSPSVHHQRRRKRNNHHGHGHGRGRDSDDDTAVEEDSESLIPGSWPVMNGEVRFKDLLSHGVVVSVNGQPWNRIVAHVSDADDEEEDPEADADDEEDHEQWDDDPSTTTSGNTSGAGEEGGMTRRRPRRARFTLSAGNAAREAGSGVAEKRRKEKKNQGDRAVVVVYGLGPGKEYEIELRVVGMFGEGFDGIVSSSVLIPPSPSPNPGPHPRSRANSLRSRSNPRSRSNSINAPPDSPLSGRATPPIDPPVVAPTPILSPSDAQAAQLRQHIAAAHAEKEHLQNQIKEARRSSQRAEAALRVEIETVKRAIEKAGTMDMRAKQKALALQEQVKQGWAGAEAAEKEMIEVQGGLADLERVFEEVKLELDTIKDEWKIVKDREDEIREKERKARAEEDKKLAEVVSKVDKLKAKKEKKENERSELEHKLEDLERQREELERRNEEQKHRRGSGYWPPPSNAGPVLPRGQWETDLHDGLGPGRLSTHPSLTNLNAPGHGYSGTHRGRGGYGPRFPTSGPVRPINPPQPSPTHNAPPFYANHPASPSVRPPRSVSAAPGSSASAGTGITSPSQVHRAISGGVNASAAPFHPTNYNNGNANEHHTTMMPPQLQHRIYLPNVRPRPTPNFHPPPSVLAERQSSPTTLSPPQFPPLPGTTTSSSSGPTAPGAKPGGPSLASIVTRAVLSPTSTLAGPSTQGSGGPVRTNSSSSTSPTPPPQSLGSISIGQRVNFAPMPNKDDQHSFPISNSGPWASMHAAYPGTGTGTGSSASAGAIQTMGQEDRWGRQSPAGSVGSGGGKRGE